MVQPVFEFLQGKVRASDKVLWVGALSFERRCTASLSVMKTANLSVKCGLVFDYQTQVYPRDEAKKRLKANKEIFEQFKGDRTLKKVAFAVVGPYSFQAVQDLLTNVLHDEYDFVIFDITCMTKIHTLALAAFLSTPRHFDWIVAYSTPENYGSLTNPAEGAGWKDIITLPLMPAAKLLNETYSRGIVLTGHEADRLIVALAELQPMGGVIISPTSEKRPDLGYLSHRLNSKVIRQLTLSHSMMWTKQVIDLTESVRLSNAVHTEAIRAKEHRAPVILFPFGPKAPLFYAALQLCSEYASGSWFVYPIPSTYNVNYTEGIEDTIWFTRSGQTDKIPLSRA